MTQEKCLFLICNAKGRWHRHLLLVASLFAEDLADLVVLELAHYFVLHLLRALRHRRSHRRVAPNRLVPRPDDREQKIMCVVVLCFTVQGQVVFDGWQNVYVPSERIDQ